jgi:hypothetical protein
MDSDDARKLLPREIQAVATRRLAQDSRIQSECFFRLRPARVARERGFSEDSVDSINASSEVTMAQERIFGPFFAMMFLTLVVWIYMYVRRIGFISSNQVSPTDLAVPGALAQMSPPSDNLKNLFEMPVLFYAKRQRPDLRQMRC